MSQKSIKKNFMYNVSLKILNVVFPLITFPYVARVLSPEGIGKVDFSLSIILYFILLAQLGIPIYAVRECAKFRENQEKLSKTVQEILIINVIMVVISYLVFAIVIINVEKLAAYRELLLIASFNIFATSIGIEWFFQSIEEYRYIVVRSFFVKIVSLILIFTLIKDENDFVMYGLIIVLSNAIGYIYNFYYANKYVKLFRVYKYYNIKRHIRPILILFLMSIAVSIYVNLDKVMLGFISSDVSVGLYTAANKLIRVVLALVTALGTVLLPRMSYYVEKNEGVEIKKLISKSLDFTLMISIPATIGILMLAEPIINIFAGEDYIESITTLRILSPLIIVIALNNLIGIQILVSHGKEVITVIATIAGATVNLTLNLYLIPIFQQNGAAVGSVVAEIVVTIIIIFFAFNYIKGNIKYKSLFHYLIGGATILFICLIIDKTIDSVIMNMIFSILISFISYFGFLYVLKNELVFDLTNKALMRLFKK